jgi:hypothetical protein
VQIVQSTELFLKQAAALRQCRVLRADENGMVTVAAGKKTWRCLVLRTSEGPPLRLAAGDAVLVWPAKPHCLILGRIASSPVPTPAADVPEELVLEAKKNLTLKCGDGWITFRADGKILIKGKDLVSHAQRLNRIKGGSVAIN